MRMHIHSKPLIVFVQEDAGGWQNNMYLIQFYSKLYDLTVLQKHIVPFSNCNILVNRSVLKFVLDYCTIKGKEHRLWIGVWKVKK